MSQQKEFISTQEEELIIEAIRRAEKDTSGEIRVHIEDEHTGDLKKRVQEVFHQLNMENTQQRNGVLFYLAANNREFYILGDKGIYKKVPTDFWEETIALMKKYFIKGEFVLGLREGILLAGKQLKEHFPYQRDDINELPDEISRG